MNKSKKYTNKKLKKFRKTKRGGSWFSRIFGTSNSKKPNVIPTLTATPALPSPPVLQSPPATPSQIATPTNSEKIKIREIRTSYKKGSISDSNKNFVKKFGMDPYNIPNTY
jgi:hypothetical protein